MLSVAEEAFAFPMLRRSRLWYRYWWVYKRLRLYLSECNFSLHLHTCFLYFKPGLRLCQCVTQYLSSPWKRNWACGRLPPQFPRFSTAFGCGWKPLKIARFNPVTEHFSVPHKPQFYCEKKLLLAIWADFQNDEKCISPWCDPFQKDWTEEHLSQPPWNSHNAR